MILFFLYLNVNKHTGFKTIKRLLFEFKKNTNTKYMYSDLIPTRLFVLFLIFFSWHLHIYSPVSIGKSSHFAYTILICFRLLILDICLYEMTNLHCLDTRVLCKIYQISYLIQFHVRILHIKFANVIEFTDLAAPLWE